MSWDIRFEVDFDTDPGDEPASWVDLTKRIFKPSGISIDPGTPEGGTARLTLNDEDQELDPTNPAAPYNVDLMRHARITVDYQGQTHPLFRGFVENWSPVWPDATQGKIAVTLVDATAWLALFDVIVDEDGDLDLGVQRAGERIGALLDFAGWPTDLRDLDDGQALLDPMVAQSNVLRLIVDTVEDECGTLFVAPDGTVTFRDRHSRLDVEPSLAFGPGGLKVAGVSPERAGSRLVNVSRAEMADGRVYVSRDGASVQARGTWAESVRDMVLPWHEADGVTKWDVYRFKDPHTWLNAVKVDAHWGDALATVLPARVGDLATFLHTPPGPGSADLLGHVERVSHRIGAKDWQATFDLSPYHGEGPWFRWDDPDHGWDSGARWAP